MPDNVCTSVCNQVKLYIALPMICTGYTNTSNVKCYSNKSMFHQYSNQFWKKKKHLTYLKEHFFFYLQVKLTFISGYQVPGA